MASGSDSHRGADYPQCEKEVAMSQQRPRSIIGIPIWGIFLLFLGIVFLLQTLDVLPWSLWRTLWQFWPVLLIIAGVSILLRCYSVWLVSLLIMVILGGCLGIAVWQHGPSLPRDTAMESYTAPLDDMERAEIDIDFSAGSIIVGSLPSGSSNFVEADSEVRDRRSTMGVDFQQQGGTGQLSLQTTNYRFWGDAGTSWQVNFTREIPLTMNIKSAASDMELDLRRLKVTQLRLDVAAGNCEVTLPSSAGISNVEIDTAAANVEVTIPDGVAVKILADVTLGVLDIDTSRFPKQGGYYVSPDFDSTENRVELAIECDVGRVTVR